jgi:hypothetical protein
VWAFLAGLPKFLTDHWRGAFFVTASLITVGVLLVIERVRTGTVYVPTGGWYTRVGASNILGVLKDCCEEKAPYVLLPLTVHAVASSLAWLACYWGAKKAHALFITRFVIVVLLLLVPGVIGWGLLRVLPSGSVEAAAGP